MQINISARHGHLGEKTQEKITNKLEKLSRIYDRVTAIELMVDLEHPEMPKVDLKVLSKHKPDFLASSSASEMWASIDDVVEKMEQQLRKHKGKTQDRHRSPGKLPEEFVAGEDED